MKKNNTPLSTAATNGVPSDPPHPVRRILVLDGDPFFRHRNAEVLIRHGFEVNTAEDGEAGWEELQLNHYNLVITESELPSLTGIELVKKLRSAHVALPVIVATKKLPAAQVTRSLRLHHMFTLLKPYTIEEFLDVVRVVLDAIPIEDEELAPPNRPSRQPAMGLRL